MGGVVLLLGCSGLFGTGPEVPPTGVEPVPAIVPVPPPAPGQLPSTAGWDRHRMQELRMGIEAPDGWSVSDEGGVLTVTTPGGARVTIAPAATCAEDPAAMCGVLAGRSLDGETWCAVTPTVGPALTSEECLTVAAMMPTLKKAPGKDGRSGARGEKGGKRTQ